MIFTSYKTKSGSTYQVDHENRLYRKVGKSVLSEKWLPFIMLIGTQEVGSPLQIGVSVDGRGSMDGISTSPITEVLGCQTSRVITVPMRARKV